MLPENDISNILRLDNQYLNRHLLKIFIKIFTKVIGKYYF